MRAIAAIEANASSRTENGGSFSEGPVIASTEISWTINLSESTVSKTWLIKGDKHIKRWNVRCYVVLELSCTTFSGLGHARHLQISRIMPGCLYKHARLSRQTSFLQLRVLKLSRSYCHISYHNSAFHYDLPYKVVMDREYHGSGYGGGGLGGGGGYDGPHRRPFGRSQ